MHTERHMFPGGNTSRGFFNSFNYILPLNVAENIYILKGGPGTGKSTLMKKIAQKAIQEDLDLEFMHCPSDPSSLDAVVIPKKKVALLDGTAPHITDPKFPGAVDEIIDLGEFWNAEAIKKHKEQIMAVGAEKSRIFIRAYRYLKASIHIYENLEEIYSLASDKGRLNIVSSEIIEKIFGENPVTEKEGVQRRLLASAITPEGLKNFLPSVLNTTEKIVVKGSPGTGTEKILERVLDASLMRGYYTECFYCALNPEKLEHIVIPDKDISITTSNKYHMIPSGTFATYNLDNFLNKKVLEQYEDFLEYNRLEFEGLLNRAVYTLDSARTHHQKLEKTYIENMDFEKMNEKIDTLIAKIFN